MIVRDVSESWGAAGAAAPRADDTPFLPRILFSLRRRAGLIVLIWAVIVAAAAISLSLHPPLYRAEAMLEVRPEQPLISDPSDPGLASSMQLWESYFRTQVSILQSRKLLEQVLNAASLPIVEEYRNTPDGPGALAEQLEVEAIPSSFILRIAVIHPSAERGPELVNSLVQMYLKDATGRWRELKTDAAELLDRETLPAIQRRLDEADKNLRNFQEQTGFADFEEQYDSLLESRRRLTNQLAEIRLKRVKLQSEQGALKGATGDTLPGLFNPALQGTRVLEPLLLQRTALETQIASESQIFKERHPRMVTLRRQLAEIKVQLGGLVLAVVQSIDRELEAVLLEEKSLLEVQEKGEQEIADSRMQKTHYKQLEGELAGAREIYNQYVKKADNNKATSKGGLASVRVIDLAKSPAKSAGKDRLILTVAAVIGLLLGLTAAVFVEELDDRILTPREVEVFFGIDVLAIVPRLNNVKNGSKAPLVLTDRPSSLNLEVFRMLRAEVAGALESVPGGRVVAVAGPRYGEGKSTVAVNLARVFAMEERRVLLIDGDLRRPQLKAMLGRRNGMGLEEYLRGEGDLRSCAQPSRLPLVDVIGAQQELTNPGEVAGSDRFRSLLREARRIYDYVIIDAGAANLISEVASMSRQADGTVLVLQYHQTRRRAVRLAMRRLQGSRVVGAVINGVPARETDLQLGEPAIPPDVRRELAGGDDLVAIVEEELQLSPKSRTRTNGSTPGR